MGHNSDTPRREALIREHRGSMTNRQMAVALGCSPSTVSGLIHRMVGRGLLKPLVREVPVQEPQAPEPPPPVQASPAAAPRPAQAPVAAPRASPPPPGECGAGGGARRPSPGPWERASEQHLRTRRRPAARAAEALKHLPVVTY